MISALLNRLSADVFDPHEVATANWLTGTAAWTGGLTFSLVVGALATTIGYGPLFACLTLFDIIGATVVIALLRGTAKRSAIYPEYLTLSGKTLTVRCELPQRM